MKLSSLKSAGVAAFITTAGALCGCLAAAAQEVSVGVSIHATADFEAPLAPQGAWVAVGSYGRCWRPAGVAVGWRPYCEGEWVWTDCGWYWQTDEPWGWACYHYGSWVDDPGVGWVWVPGIEWAPAWVVWRTGGGYIGWAPCAPRGAVVAPGLFAFVEVGHFNGPIRTTTVVINNTTIINKTTQINEIKRENRTIGGRAQKVVVNEGPGVAEVEKATGKKVSVVSVVEADRRTSAPANLKPAGRRDGTETTPKPAEARPAQPPERGTLPGREERVVPPPQRPVQPSEGVRQDRPKEVEKVPERGNPPREGGNENDKGRGREGGGDENDKRGRGGGEGGMAATPPLPSWSEVSGAAPAGLYV